ncbi:MAG: TRAP transporter large permease [Thalassovita sp.]
MGWEAFLFVALGGLIFLLFLGVPVFVGFLTLNILGTLWLIGPRGFGMFVNSIGDTATSQVFATVALFVLMGELLFRSGTVDVLFDSIDRLVGRLKGRLYVVAIALSTVFGALSGSAVAVAAMLGRSLTPKMESRGYDRKLSASTILAGASLAPIIPPSLLAILVGSMADVSIAKLLIAGVVPGIMIAAITLAYVLLRMPPMPNAAEPDRSTSVGMAGLRMMPFLMVIFSVMGMIMLGIATPSESAATGVLGALIVAAVFGRLNMKMIGDSLMSAVGITATLLIIVCSAKLFSQLLSFAGTTRGLVEFVSNLPFGPDVTFLVLMLIPFFLCMFVDQVAFMLLAIPLYQPVVSAMGYDPVWFWTLFLINLTVGSITPPFGYTLFALKGANQALDTRTIYAAAWPVVGLFIVSMVIMWAAPALVTWLPSLF